MRRKLPITALLVLSFFSTYAQNEKPFSKLSPEDQQTLTRRLSEYVNGGWPTLLLTGVNPVCIRSEIEGAPFLRSKGGFLRSRRYNLESFIHTDPEPNHPHEACTTGSCSTSTALDRKPISFSPDSCAYSGAFRAASTPSNENAPASQRSRSPQTHTSAALVPELLRTNSGAAQSPTAEAAGSNCR